jgi:hypothetical protein
MEAIKFWESLPLVWLVILCIFDFKNEFTLRTFFCQVVTEAHRRMEEFRGRGKNWQCPNLYTPYKCPIFYTLDINKPELPERCPKMFKEVKVEKPENKEHTKAVDAFWTTVQKGFMRYNQATYFEIIFIQFFIIGLTTNLKEIRYISAFFAIVIFLFPYFLLTYQEQKPLTFFENKKKRLLFAIFMWFFVVGLSMTSYFPINIS